MTTDPQIAVNDITNNQTSETSNVAKSNQDDKSAVQVNKKWYQKFSIRVLIIAGIIALIIIIILALIPVYIGKKDSQSPSSPDCLPDSSRPSTTPSSYNSNTCPTDLLYISSFLTLSSSFRFQYPVLQEVICTGSSFELRCPNSQRIYIISAYYGIQSDTSTACSTNPTPVGMCYRSSTVDSIISVCESNSTCKLLLTSSNFGDPCIGQTNKQMLVKYQCLDPSTYNTVSLCPKYTNLISICPSLSSSGAQYEQKWCEPTTMTITCSGGNVINIVCGFYGIDPVIKCNGGFYTGAPTACYSTNTIDKIKTGCNSKTTCSFSGDPSFESSSGFSNICPGFSNTLYVSWQCVASFTTTAPTIAPTAAPSLPYCTAGLTPNGNCSTGSPYEPTFLTNSTQSSFGYPIYELAVCNAGKTVLLCPNQLVIHIYSAYFGIQQNTKTTCNSYNGEIPAKCYYNSSFTQIKSKCEFQSSCLLVATSANFSITDPCVLYPKQLFVQYQCVDNYGLNTTISKCDNNITVPLICPASSLANVNENTWCDTGNAPMTIDCGVGKKINIICAFYGLHPSITACTLPANTPICYFESSLTSVNNTCSGQQTCTIDFLNDFTDPCFSMDKALYVQWQCF